MSKTQLASHQPQPKPIIIREGYFLSRVVKRSEGYLPSLPDYLLTLQLNGDILNEGLSGVICVWDQARVGKVNNYQDKIFIFTKLRHAMMAQRLIANGGKLNTAVFYRKWDPELKQYHTVETFTLKFIRLPRRVYDAIRAIQFKGMGKRIVQVLTKNTPKNADQGTKDKV